MSTTNTPQPDVPATKPAPTAQEKAHDLQLLVALLATDWIRGDKTHLDEITTLTLALVEELHEAAPAEKAPLVAKARALLEERAEAKPAARR